MIKSVIYLPVDTSVSKTICFQLRLHKFYRSCEKCSSLTAGTFLFPNKFHGQMATKLNQVKQFANYKLIEWEFS